jgi:hypothetical protein
MYDRSLLAAFGDFAGQSFFPYAVALDDKAATKRVRVFLEGNSSSAGLGENVLADG